MKTSLTGLLLLAACSGLGQPQVVAPERADAAAGGQTPTGATPPAEPDASLPDVWVSIPEVNTEAAAAEVAEPQANDVVYAHSGSDLFRVDPVTLDVTRVGILRIMGPTGVRYLNDVTDIAVDRARRIVGITYRQLLEIDGATGECKPIAPLPNGERFNGLSWIRAAEGQPETLVATSYLGGVFRIDPTTGMASEIGNLGGGQQSSGDLVSVQGYGTLLTIKSAGNGNDRLARLDPATGTATVIGDVGFAKVWGLGFWKNKVFGFTSTGGFILIDPRTGAGMLVQNYPAFPFFGAGVTTSVPVVID
jgi:hypothetical protein